MLKLYCKIIDGTVTNPEPLPDSFKTKDNLWITGFKHLSSEEALNHGFYEFIIPDVEYNKETQDVRFFQNTLNKDNKTVSPVYDIIDKPQVQLKPLNSTNLNIREIEVINNLLNSSLPVANVKSI